MKGFHLLILAWTCAIFSSCCFAVDTYSSSSTKTIINPTPRTESSPPQTDNTTVASTNKIGELTGTFDLTTNYIWRGFSLSNNLPAVQGGLTYTFLKPGIYFNLWGSSTYLPDPENNETATIEIDTVAGIANNITDNFSYDISFARYNYPKAPSAQYNELLTKWAYKILLLTLTAEIDYSNNVFNSSKGSTYYNGRADFDIPPKYLFNINDVTASGSFGHFSLPRSAGLNSYNDYMLGLAKKIASYTLSVQWTGTNGRFNYGTYDDNRFIGTVTVDF